MYSISLQNHWSTSEKPPEKKCPAVKLHTVQSIRLAFLPMLPTLQQTQSLDLLLPIRSFRDQDLTLICRLLTLAGTIFLNDNVNSQYRNIKDSSCTHYN